MSTLDDLLAQKGRLYHDLEFHTARSEDARKQLVPITAEINRLLQEAQQAPKPPASEPAVA